MTFAGFKRGARHGRGAEVVPLLLDAGVLTIVDLGAAKCTAEEVSRRAGVAPAALYRHFGTLDGFLIACAEEVACRQLVSFQTKLDAALLDDARDERPSIEVGMTLLAELSAAPINGVFHELMIASRTDPGLAAILRPLLGAYARDIQAIATQLPGLDTIDPDLFRELIRLVLDLFRGTSVRRGDHLERIPLIMAILRGDLAFLLGT